MPEYSVTASNFMAFHTILKTSKDYYTALKRARELTAKIEETINKNLTAEQVCVHHPVFGPIGFLLVFPYPSPKNMVLQGWPELSTY